MMGNPIHGTSSAALHAPAEQRKCGCEWSHTDAEWKGGKAAELMEQMQARTGGEGVIEVWTARELFTRDIHKRDQRLSQN